MHKALFFIILFSPTLSFAFNRSKTCITSLELEERGDEAPTGAPTCIGNNRGEVFRWNKEVLSYSIHDSGIEQFPGEEGKKALIDEIRRSFQTWEDVECSVLSFEGSLSSSFGHRIDDENWIGFYDEDDWPHSSFSVAVTTVTTLTDGTITDADIEINSHGNPLSLSGENAKFDLRNFLTHEIGHLIGLDHSAESEATMQYQTLVGQTKKQDLHADDEAGLCEIFPEDFEPIDIDDDSDGCCSTIQAKPGAPLWLFFSLLFVVSFRRMTRAS